MHQYLKTLLATAVVAFSAFGANQAFAVASVRTTFNFVGNCVDCAQAAHVANSEVSATEYEVTGRLVLDGYTVGGGSFTLANFVSFTYDGSNLLPGGFTFLVSDMDIVEGFFNGDSRDLSHRVNLITLPTFDGPIGTYDYFFAESNYFEIGQTTFVTCVDNCDKDYGSGNWSTIQTSNVPEPGSLLLMGGALAGLGLVHRRKSSRRST